MKKLIVNIYQEDNKVGEGEYVRIISENGKLFSINLSNVILFDKEIIFQNELLIIEIILCENQSDDLNFILLESLSTGVEIEFKAELNESYFNHWEDYSAIQYDLFTKWNNNIRLDWREFELEIQKKAWIRSCGRLADITKNSISKKEYVIDFNEIREYLDFYCLIGEVFFGYKGYLGGDGNALSDCLYLMVKNSGVKRSKIIFKNFYKINEIFKEDPALVNDFKTFLIQDFIDNGFEVVYD